MFRSIKEAVKIIKADDPESAITEYLVRSLCLENKVRSINSGKKVLVSVTSLRAYLSGEQKEN